MPIAAAAERTIRRRRVALAATAALFAATPAAAELDAARLQSDAQARLDNYVAKSDGVLQPQGPVATTRDGDVVVLTVPALVVEADARRLDIPPIVLRLDEIGDDRLAFDVTLPSEVSGVRGPPAPDVLKLTLGAQSIAGVLRPSLATYESFRFRLGAINLTTGEGGFEIGSIQADGANVEGVGDRWDSDTGLLIENLRVFDGDLQTMASVDRIEQESVLKHFDLPAYIAINNRITGGFAMNLPDPDDPTTKDATLEMVRRLPELLDGADGGTLFRLTGLDVAAIDGPAFELGEASLEIGMAPTDAFYALDLNLAVDDPAVDPAGSPVPSELMPRRLHAALSLQQLPVAQLWAMMSEPIQKDIQGDPTGKAADELEMAPMAAMGAAAEAGSFAEIRRFELELGPARLTAEGVGPLVPGLPEPALRVDATIEGLEALVEEAQRLDPEIRDQALPILLMLRGLGKAEPRNDAIVHTYLIEQGPAGPGDFLVNGVSLDQIGAK